MQFYEWGRYGSTKPVRLTTSRERPRLGNAQVLPAVAGRAGVPARPQQDPIEPPDPNCETILYSFEAPDRDQAIHTFLAHQLDGIPAHRHGAPSPSQRWHYQGFARHLADAGRRLRVPESQIGEAIKRPEWNAMLRLINGPIGDLCARYHGLMQRGELPPRDYPEMRAILEVIRHNERYVAMLHCIALAAAGMLDDAYQAFGFSPPDRSFAILSDYDEPHAPSANGHAEAAEPELEPGKKPKGASR